MRTKSWLCVIRWTVVFGLAVTVGCATPPVHEKRMDTLAALKAGNGRFVHGTARHPHLSAALRKDLSAHGQHPIATILACSDSRVPVELLFDQGIGDLFVIRVAGNVVGDDETGSIEYAVEHLRCPLVVVLGHRRCGAVTAAVKHAHDTPSIEALLKHIAPAVRAAESAAPQADPDQRVEAAVRQNVWQSIADLIAASEVSREWIRAGDLTVIGAVYDIESGAVQWLGHHPHEANLVSG